MTYGIIRLLFGLVFCMFGLLLIHKKSPLNKRKWNIGLLIIAVLLTTLSFLFPIENAIVSFPCPEAAYSYVSSDAIKLILEGDDTALVVSGNSETNSYIILPKQGSAWKVGRGIDTKTVAKVSSGELLIYVYRYRASNEYYICIFDTSAGLLEITDDQNTQYVPLENGGLSQPGIISAYYAYMHDLIFPYNITINGETISVISYQTD